LIERTDLIKLVILFLGGNAIVTNLYSSLEEQTERERERERESDRERRPVRREEIILVTTRGTALCK
jgi:hypothetical protein